MPAHRQPLGLDEFGGAGIVWIDAHVDSAAAAMTCDPRLQRNHAGAASRAAEPSTPA